MEVIVFTEAGPQFGYGHLMRCLALAEGFLEKKLRVSFFIRGEGDFSEILGDLSYCIKDWMEEDFFLNIINSEDITIVDSYYIVERQCCSFYEKSRTVLFFDDTMRLNYPGGYVLNGVIGAENLPYPENDDITYLLGAVFQPLRKEFWSVPEYKMNENVETIMLTFGGSDPTNETPVYIQKTRELYPNAILKVIIGKGFCNVREIEDIADSKVILIYYPDAIAMRNIMLDCDLAVSAAGQTISELARVGIPVFAVQVVDNQENNYRNWHNSGVLIPQDYWGKYLPFDMRFRCSQAGLSIIDGQGVHHITEVLL